MLFISLWIDKGFGLIIGGFVPNPLEEVRTYWPTMPETLITIGVWAIGFLILTLAVQDRYFSSGSRPLE